MWKTCLHPFIGESEGVGEKEKVGGEVGDSEEVGDREEVMTELLRVK